MGSDATKRRAELVAQVEGHADPQVKEAVGVLLQEIAMLRGLVGGDGPPRLTLRGRRLVWRVVAVLLLVAGVALSVVMAMHDENALAFRQGIHDGYRAGKPAMAPESAAVAVGRRGGEVAQ
jgi:hypothetical protein